MKKILTILLAAYFLFAIHAGAFAQFVERSKPLDIPKAPFVARVDLVVDAPESIERVFEQCMKKELQSIDNVTLTKDNPQYRITVMGLPNKTQDEVLGFTFSILITRPFDMSVLRSLLTSTNIDDNQKRVLFIVGNNYEKIEKTSLLTCSPEELGRVCGAIVAGFNNDLLEKDRAMWNSALGIPQQPSEAP
jgi:hypothetical protein